MKYTSAYLSLSIYLYLSIYLSIYLSLSLSIYIYIYIYMMAAGRQRLVVVLRRRLFGLAVEGQIFGLSQALEVSQAEVATLCSKLSASEQEHAML